MSKPGQRSSKLQVRGRTFAVLIREYPFREGVEVECCDFDPPLRISDRQLGEREALRLLAEEIDRRLT